MNHVPVIVQLAHFATINRNKFISYFHTFNTVYIHCFDLMLLSCHMGAFVLNMCHLSLIFFAITLFFLLFFVTLFFPLSLSLSPTVLSPRCPSQRHPYYAEPPPQCNNCPSNLCEPLPFSSCSFTSSAWRAIADLREIILKNTFCSHYFW